MRTAYRKQKFQDWFTQQWAIFWGRKINPVEFPWLMGPFGQIGTIGDQFIYDLAEKENLIIEREVTKGGLISSINDLQLNEKEATIISEKVVHFYENTASYNLSFEVQWNPIFKLGGNLITKLFSLRIKQLNIPKGNLTASEEIKSEIIQLKNPVSNEVKYTIWYRTFPATGQVLYSGIYETCLLSSGKTCIKAVFPLPKGNATVIMEPTVNNSGALILNSSGKKFGDSGFYFLLNDAKGDFYADFKSSFRDQLIVSEINGNLIATQKLTLWNKQVLKFNYKMCLKN